MSSLDNPSRKLQTSKTFKGIVIAAWITMAVALRYVFFPVESYDMRAFLVPWYDFIVEHGQFKSFAYAFYDYSPLYLYMVSFSTLFEWIPKITAIKIISILFDFSAGLAVFKIVKLKRGEAKPAWFAFIGDRKSVV